MHLKKKLVILLLSALIITGLIIYKQTADTPQGYALVAHAGAAIKGYKSANTIEAVKNAAALGYEYIELDMITTTDGRIVLNHDWDVLYNRIPGIPAGNMPYAEFMSLRIFNQFTPTDLDMLIDFLSEDTNPRIITDTKNTNYAALYEIAQNHPEYINRFIPQAYAYDDVKLIADLGFKDIILTIYEMSEEDRNPGKLHSFAVKNKLYGVTLPDIAADDNFFDNVNVKKMRYMVHTIDNLDRARELYDKGVYAVYTDFIIHTQDKTGITRNPLPVQRSADKITENINKTIPDAAESLTDIFMYKIDEPAYIYNGEALPIWEYYLVSSIFIHPYNDMAYFIDRHFDPYHETRDYDQQTRTFYITKNGEQYIIGGYDTDELVIYNDMYYFSQDAVKDVFGFDTTVKDDYVILTPAGDERYDKDYLTQLAGLLFTND